MAREPGVGRGVCRRRRYGPSRGNTHIATPPDPGHRSRRGTARPQLAASLTSRHRATRSAVQLSVPPNLRHRSPEALLVSRRRETRATAYLVAAQPAAPLTWCPLNLRHRSPATAQVDRWRSTVWSRCPNLAGLEVWTLRRSWIC